MHQDGSQKANLNDRLCHKERKKLFPFVSNNFLDRFSSENIDLCCLI
jgi:hypothetical protein